MLWDSSGVDKEGAKRSESREHVGVSFVADKTSSFRLIIISSLIPSFVRTLLSFE